MDIWCDRCKKLIFDVIEVNGMTGGFFKIESPESWLRVNVPTLKYGNSKSVISVCLNHKGINQFMENTNNVWIW